MRNKEKERRTIKAYRIAHRKEAKLYAIKYYTAHREELLAYKARWRIKHRKELLQKQHIYQIVNREKRNAYLREYNHRPDVRRKIKARDAANSTIPVKKCTECGSNEQLVRHHSDYNKPLDVLILCKDCHLQIHREETMKRYKLK